MIGRWPFTVWCLRIQDNDLYGWQFRNNLDMHIDGVARGSGSAWWFFLRDGLWLNAEDPR